MFVPHRSAHVGGDAPGPAFSPQGRRDGISLWHLTFVCSCVLDAKLPREQPHDRRACGQDYKANTEEPQY